MPKSSQEDVKEFISDILHTERPGRRKFKTGPYGFLGETTRSKIAKTEFL